MYRNIVIGYDGTDHARDAATLALALGEPIYQPMLAQNPSPWRPSGGGAVRK